MKLGKHILLLLGLLAGTLGLFAQQGNNPFELPDRTIPSVDTIPEANVPTAEIAIQSSFEATTNSATNLGTEEITTDQNNPFEVSSSPTIPVATESPDSFENNASTVPSINDQNPFEIKKTTFSKPKTTIAPPANKSATTTFEPLSGKFKLWMTILLVTILTVLVNIYKSVLAKVYRSFLNDNFLKMVHRDYGAVTMIPYLILYAFSLILIGTFLFIILNYYQIALFSTPILNLLVSVGAVFAIFFTKHFVLQILGSIFPISKEIEQYSFTIIIFGIMIGFLLLPAILLISYAPPNLTTTLIYGTFIVIVLIYLYRILRSLFIGLKYISLHKFHFFVYLCTIEIAPLLVLTKLVMFP